MTTIWRWRHSSDAGTGPMTKAHYRIAKESSFLLFTILVIAAFVVAGFTVPASALFALAINLSARMTATALARRKLRKFAEQD
jgi:hypothetical protein